MNREELQRELASRIAQLRTLNETANTEQRELTPHEQDQVVILRSEMAELNVQLNRPTQPAEEPRQPVAAPWRDQTLSRGAPGDWLGGRTSDDPGAGIRRVAEEVAEAVKAGASIRRAITMPVGWTTGSANAGDPLDVTDLAAYFTSTGVNGTTADVLRVDATDGQIVAEGADKPDIVTGTLVPAVVKKIAGMAIITTEGLTFIDGAQQAIQNVLRGAIISGQNTVIVDAIEADGTEQVFVTDALTTVLTAMAMVGTKAPPSVIIASPADYVSLALQLAVLPQSLSIPGIVVSDDVETGTVVVAARSGVQVARTQVGLLVDPFTLAHENKTRIIAEMFMAASVVRPNVVYLAATAAATP